MAANMDLTRVTFDRGKIYEKLDYKPEPIAYNKKIPWIVQQQIAATNGNHYYDLTEKLNDYPIPDLPVKNVSGGLMLDIGCGWGRWLLAAEKKGYIPIGIDLRLEFCRTARKIMGDLGCQGYAAVADFKNLPFKAGIFDLIWSFSVIQHVHKERLLSCLRHVSRLLKPKAFCLLQFPNKDGLRNRLKNISKSEGEQFNYNSWCVRYYSFNEYKEIFGNIFNNFELRNQSFIGIGVVPSDLKYISTRNKPSVLWSLFMSLLTDYLPSLRRLSDSIYVKAWKSSQENTEKDIDTGIFMESHRQNPSDNLNLRHIIRCPVSGGELILDKQRNELVSEKAGLAFPVVDDIPILIESEARKI